MGNFQRRLRKLKDILGSNAKERATVNNDVGRKDDDLKVAENLITASSILSEFRLGVQAVSTDKNLIGRTLKIKIKNIKITDKNKKIEITFPDVEVEGIPIKSEFGNVSESIKTKELFSTVFPSPGMYWLELEVVCISMGYEIETKQRGLNGKIGRGWSESEKDVFKRVKKYFLRQPILVVDSVAISQTKINRSIKFLTIIMMVLTVFIVLLAFLQYWWCYDP